MAQPNGGIAYQLCDIGRFAAGRGRCSFEQLPSADDGYGRNEIENRRRWRAQRNGSYRRFAVTDRIADRRPLSDEEQPFLGSRLDYRVYPFESLAHRQTGPSGLARNRSLQALGKFG